MADYNITFPDGSPHTIQTGTIDNTYDIPLVGQDAINYGDDFATAYVRLLSNFANTSAPSFGTTRTKGQLWYDTTPSTGGLKVYDGTGWDTIALTGSVVTLTGSQTISGTKTFSSGPAFTAATPFTVDSPTLVANLNADLLDGNESTAFATASQGVLADNAEPDLGLPPVNGYVLSSTTGGTRSWVSPAVGTGNVNPADISGAGSPATMSLLLTDNPTGDQQPYTDSGLTFNGTTNTLTTTTFVGNLTGNADTATLATSATTATSATQVSVNSVDGAGGDTAMYPLLVAANTATDQAPHTDVGQLSYNASSGTLTAAAFSGNGALVTALNANNVSTGTLAVLRGGTGVTTATGSGSAVVLHTAPTFVTRISVPEIRNGSSGVDLQWNSIDALGTQLYNGTDNVSGAYVRDGGNTLRSVGFNVMDTTGVGTSGTTTLGQATAGHSYRATNSSGVREFQVPATDTSIPNGATWIIRNFTTSTGTVQIDSTGAGDILRHYNGSGTLVSSVAGANPFTLARGGVATIVKVADGEYEMWGIGITGGA